jgi:uncharacterized membrane protein (UPF0127 family)
MRKKRFSNAALIPAVIVLVVIAAVVIAIVSTSGETKTKTTPIPSTSYNSECGVYRNDKTVTINGTSFKTEVTKTKEEYEKGLGGRPCILPDQAMLFSYTKPLSIKMWMKDMKFPIDIVWLGPDKKVAGIEVGVKPSTYPDLFVNKDHPAQYVLELKANRSKELKMDIGTPVQF